MADFLLSVGVDVGLSYTEMQKDISKLVSQLNSNPPKIKVAFDIDDKAISNLRTQIAEISKALGTSGAAVKADSGTSSTASVNAQIRQRINLENEAKQATTSAATAKRLADDQAMKSELSRQALLKKSYTLLTQMQNAENKWTAAKTGKSSSAYTAIQSDIASLQQWNMEFKNGTITADQFSAKLSSLSSNFTTNSNTIKNAGEATQTWSQRLGTLSAKFGTWFSITRVIMAAYRALRQMVTAVIDVDTAMTELKKVTDETDETYNKFLDNAAVRAKELGAALADVVSASADFARLGFNIEEAEALADAAIVYKNVGDGITDISDASESIIATMQAFGVEAKDVMTIVDKFNEVGNNYAISSKGVGDALLRSAAAMNAANNTLDETIALAAASNTIVQDPEKVGTTLKTVSMYLRAAKTEAEDAGESTEGMANSVSELRDEILALTGNKVDIQIDEDTFKSTYQILKELSEVWGGLSDISQANILEMVGGKRNSNVVAAILENFSVAEDALETSMASAGSALEENEKYLESINGKISILKASFQELSNNIIGSEVVKFFVELGTTLLNIINGITGVVNAFGGLKTVLLAVVSALLIAKGGLIAYKVQLIAVAAIQKIITFFSNLKTGIMNIVNIIPNAIVAWKAYAAGTITASTAMQASIPVIGLVLSALTLLAGGMALASDSSEDMSEEVADTSQELQQLAQAAADSSEKIIDLTFSYLEANNALNTLTGTVETYTNARQDLINGLEIEQTELQKLIDKYGEYDKALASASLSKLKDLEIDLRGGVDIAADALLDARESDIVGRYGAFKGIVTQDNVDIEQEVLDAYEALKNLPEGLELIFNKTNVLIDQESDEVKEGYYIFANEASEAAIDAYGYTTADILHQYEVYKSSLKVLADTVGTDNILYKGLYENYTDIQSAVKGFIDARDTLNANMASQYVLSAIIEDGVPETKEEFNAWRQSIIDASSASGDFSGTLDVITSSIDSVLSQQAQFKGFFDDITKSAYNFTAALSSVQSLESGFNKLDKIYADIYDKGDFDWGSILNNEDFAKTFGFLGDSYTNFIKTVSNSSSDINTCRVAFNDLAHAYLLNSGALSDVTDETRNATIAMLKQMGIANAAVIVDEQLAIKTKRLSIQKKLQKDVYETSSTTIADFIQQLYSEAGAIDITKEAYINLIAQETIFNNNNLDTTQKIEQLQLLAKQAGLTSKAMALMSVPTSVLETKDADIEDINRQRREWLKNAGITWEVIGTTKNKAGVKVEDWVYEYNGKEYQTFDSVAEAWYTNLFTSLPKTTTTYTGGSSTQQTNKQTETWFGKQLKEHQHLVAMEEETTAEFLKWLDSAYKKAYKQGIITIDEYYKYEEEVFQGIQDLCDNAKDALDKLTDYRIDMLKQEIKDEQDALDKKLDNLQEFYDKQKEMLQDQYDEERYLEEQAEKRKSVAAIKSELAMLEKDDSVWAQRRKLELGEELATAEKDLDDFEKENALEKALDAIDEAYNSQEAQIQREMEALEEKLNDPNALFNQALEDIRNNSKNQLYYQMLMYNRQYGDGNDETIKNLWKEIYGTLNDYQNFFGNPYQGIVLNDETNPNPSPPPSPSSSQATSTSSLSSGDTVKIKTTATHFGSKSNGVKMASYVPGGSYTVYQTSGDQVLIGRNGVYTGWVKKSDIEGYASGTKHATAGLHELFEQGDEYIFSASDGSRYRMFSGGEKVLNAKATEFLYDFANSGGDVLAQMLKNVFSGAGLDDIAPTVINNEFNMGDIIVQGSANERTVSEIRRAQRESVDFMLKEFTKLNK